MSQISVHSLNFIDYFIIAIILFSTLISLIRGFISEAVSLLTWIIAAIIAFRSAASVGHLFSSLIHNPSIRLIIGFIIVFIIILIIGSIINHFLVAFIRSTGLSGPNRLLGMIFGFTRGVLLIAIFILFAQATSVVRENWWLTSQLIPYFQGITRWLHQIIPGHFYQMSHFLNHKAGTS